MSNGVTFQNNALSIEMIEFPDSVHLHWTGKSVDRDPGFFVMPIFTEALKRCGDEKRLVVHFEKLQYMNSSTITPVIRVINMIKTGKEAMSVMYAKSLRWQELSFSALKILESKDGRISVIGD